MHRSAENNGSRWVCQSQRHMRNRGVFYGDNPFDFASLILYTQLSLSALLTAFFQLILTPLGESAFISQMLAGIIMGPSFLGKDNSFRSTVFPMKSFYVSETFAFFGCMLFMFLVGVKMDLSMVRKSGRRALVIGICAFLVPLMLNIAFAIILKHKITMDPDLHKSLIFIAAFQSSSSFHVIVCLLADLKLLNSELGRLAVSSSMISGTCSWICSIITFTIRQSSLTTKQASLPWMALMSLVIMLIIIIYILRPIFSWMIEKTGKEKELSESHFFCIFVMVLGCALLGEVIGQHFMFGPIVLGLAVPDGPPLGSALVDKLGSYVSSILLPGYFVFSCARINLSLTNVKTVGIVEMLALCSLLGKLMGTMLPSLYYELPVLDSLSLGLIMSAQGITDILILQHGMLLHLIDQESYSIMVISAVLITGIITPMVKLLYNPSKRYMSMKRRRTIQHTMPNAELRLLACIHHQDITPSIINLLEVSHPTLKSPIALYVVHLIQLLGRSSPLLITHRQGHRISSHSNQSDHIINAFHLFEEINCGTVLVNAFTAIAPYATMHDEICSLALEKRASLVIIPFHQQWKPQGTEELSEKPIRTVNLKILNSAPCSVGILVDRGTLSGNIKTMKSRPFYRIVVIFLGGADDREALSYAMRMAEHPDVGITVIQFLLESKKRGKNLVSRELDFEMIDKFKRANMHKMRHIYREEVVYESLEVINVIRSLQNLYDLVLVGRRHASNSPLLMGLTMWNEFPELGSLGEMLASSDSNWEVSLLVVQQQSCGGEEVLGFKCFTEDSFAVDMSRATAKLSVVKFLHGKE